MSPPNIQRGKKHQRLQFDELWQLFVQACGSKCCVCGKDDVPLQHGHIQRRADDGADGMKNLIPICKPCNSKYNKALLTPDNRPADWLSNFLKLQIQHFHLRTQVKQQCTQVDQSQTTENTKFIPLDELSFEADSELSTQVYLPAAPPTPAAITAAVRDLIRRGKSHRFATISIPSARARNKMDKLARLHGIKAFSDAGAEMLEQEDWFTTSGDFVRMLYHGQEWERFCDNFDVYVKDARQRAVRRAKQAADDIEHEKKMALLRAEDAAAEKKYALERKFKKAAEDRAIQRQVSIDTVKERLAESIVTKELEQKITVLLELLIKNADDDDAYQWNQHVPEIEKLLEELDAMQPKLDMDGDLF